MGCGPNLGRTVRSNCSTWNFSKKKKNLLYIFLREKIALLFFLRKAHHLNYDRQTSTVLLEGVFDSNRNISYDNMVALPPSKSSQITCHPVARAIDDTHNRLLLESSQKVLGIRDEGEERRFVLRIVTQECRQRCTVCFNANRANIPLAKF